jgi:hypothetical protein
LAESCLLIHVSRRTLQAMLSRRTFTLIPALVAGAQLFGGTTASAATDESWKLVSRTRFTGQVALERTQGAATDGRSWYFSWREGLSRVTLDGTVTQRNGTAITPELAAQGFNHIGDMDYHDGKLYVALEDESPYDSPTIAVFDAGTLQYTGVSARVPTTAQTHMPWVAVDAAHGLLYTSDWDPVNHITVLDLDDMSFVGTVPLSQTIGRVQGAKMFNGVLYASTDDATYTVFRIEPTTGEVTTAIDRHNLPAGTHAEGLAFLPTDDGAVMHVLDIAPNRLAQPDEPVTDVWFRHYRLED